MSCVVPVCPPGTRRDVVVVAYAGDLGLHGEFLFSSAENAFDEDAEGDEEEDGAYDDDDDEEERGGGRGGAGGVV